MKVSRAQADANRERIIETAGRLFREHGVDGIGLNDLMQAAGLTRGGFYGHFESKDDLVVQASRQAFADNLARWAERADGPDGLATLVRMYLSDRHRDAPDRGCSVAALGADAARADAALRAVFTEGVEGYLAVLQALMPGEDDAVRRRQALAAHAMLIGALVVARATRGAAVSDEIREAVARSLLGD